MSAPSLAAVTGSLRQSARRLPGADVSAHCDGGTRQLRSCILDEPIGDSGMVGRSIASADVLISLEVRAPFPAETRLPECREQKAQDEWSSMKKAMVYYKNGGPEAFQRADVDKAAVERFETVLAAGQSAAVSIPRAAGEAPARIVLSNAGGHLHIAEPPVSVATR